MSKQTSEWYAVQVRAGDEDNVVEDCKKLLRPDRGEEVFTMKRKKELHGFGSWYTVPYVQFPGYVFFQTDDIGYVCRALKPLGQVKRILSAGSEITPLHEAETKLLLALGGSDHMIDISIGYKEEGGTVILSGPLTGREDMIVKVNRHKRIAKIGTAFAGDENGMWVGLRIYGSLAEAENALRQETFSFSPVTEIPEPLRDKIA